jgi:cytosine deaminase
MHVHLDKAFTVERTGMSAGGLPEAVRLSMLDLPNRTEADLRHRMELGVRAAWAHGTVAMRTHLDTPGLSADSAAWRVFDALRAQWSGRVALQAVALMAIERADDDDLAERFAQIASRGGIAGAFIAPGSATPERLARFLDEAEQHGLDVDFHVDETLDPAADGLRLIADAVLRTGFAGRVVAGHCCALAAKPRDEALRVLDLVADAGIHVVSLPLTNLFLMDRAPETTPLRRGLTLVREMRARGIPVAFASDKVRDPVFPPGDCDRLEVLRTAARAAHLEDALAEWIGAASMRPAAAMGSAGRGRFAPGAAADMIVFRARNWIELMSRPQADRLVIRDGALLAAGSPDFDELNLLPEAR